MCEYWRRMFGKKSGVFLLQSIIHLIFICGILRSFGLILKFTWFFNKVLSNACCKKRKIEQLQAFKTRLGMCDTMSNYMLAQSLVLTQKWYEIKNLGHSETCRCHSGLGPPADWDPRSMSASGFGPPRSKSASGYGPPFADLDPPTKLSF